MDDLNAEEVAGLLRIGKSTVYRLARSGELPSYTVGRKLRFSRKDIEAYKAKGGSAFKGTASDAADGGSARPTSRLSRRLALEAPREKYILGGNGIAADLLASVVSSSGVAVSRDSVGSYTALINLYAGMADCAVSHLYDRKTNSYNVPFVQRLAPGLPVAVIRLAGMKQGLIVQDGNPKQLKTWGALLREGVRVANRERGCGSRILLDEKLVSLEADPYVIEGYEDEYPSARAAAAAVASGDADVAVGTGRIAQAFGLEFVALQDGWLDVVVAKTPKTRDLVRTLKSTLSDDSFKGELASLGCDASHTGAIVYEC